MTTSIEELLGIKTATISAAKPPSKTSFSFLFFSDIRAEIPNQEKYAFMRDITLFADREGFEAVYIPERHFHEFGSIFANSAVMAAYLIPQTQNIRFRTAGISTPLHHPAEVVEWWAMNDILSGGRVDLGFGSGWNKADFIYAPNHYHNRREVTRDTIPLIQRLWRGETVPFPGPDGDEIPITIYPRPVQKELNVWMLVTQNDEGFRYAGQQGYNIFTMLYGINLDAMAKKIAIYRQGREEAGLDPDGGTVSLMLHTLVHENNELVSQAVEKPFKAYIRSALKAHLKAHDDAEGTSRGQATRDEQERMLEYAYQRYYKTGAVFGPVEAGREVVDKAIAIGVDDIAFLLDFGVDYDFVKDSLPYLKRLVSRYI